MLSALIAFRRLRPLLMTRLRTDFVLVDLVLAPDWPIGEVFAVLGGCGVKVTGMESELGDDLEHVRLQLLVPPGVGVEDTLGHLAQMDGVRSVKAADVGLRRLLMASDER